MINSIRGEVMLEIDGRPRTLCVTLGALAKIETAFGLSSLEEMAARLAQPKATDLLTVLEALLEGGGDPLSREALEAARLNLREAANAIGAAFAGGGVSEGAPGKP